MVSLREAEQDEIVPGEGSHAPPDLPDIPQRDLVVGIGASAGGLRALQQLFAHVPPDSGMAFVVILHLSPHYQSHAAAILQRSAAIPLTQVTEAMTIAPNHAYVIPPAKHLVIVDGTIELRERPSALDALARELLISVSSFFRDAAAFAALRTQIVPKLFADKQDDERVRAWVAGCATGEEAYSIAILLRSYAAKLEAPPKIRVFATDVDDHAIAIARRGRYPETISADIPPEHLAQFFVREGGQYRVQKALREIMIFGHHNLVRDPPFSRLDLISCRNVLIYLEPEAQERLLTLFHYALRPGGYLFLGASESADGRLGLFEPIDKKQRLFVRCPVTARLPRLMGYRVTKQG